MGLGSTTNLSIPKLGEYDSYGRSTMYAPGAPAGMSTAIYPQPYDSVSRSQDRVVIQESTMSFVVKNVRQTSTQILDYAKNIGGFMVTTSYNSPNEAPFAQISVRVPTERLDEALDHFRSLAQKVTSENLVGTDVTAQYEDLETRLSMLRSTKAKFEEILERAVTVQEILEVQRELVNLQMAIDSTIGQRMALSDNAKLTKVTIYLSTDEFALPYVSDSSFRPELVFKQAVRSLVETLRGVAKALIWVVVFSVIWVPAVGVFILYKKWNKDRAKKTTPAS
jgi:hypothetical protein